jgi:acyl-homoserine lactone acylase PvdQ
VVRVYSARGLHAIRVLENKTDFTLDSLIAAAFDSYLTWFDRPLPALIRAWDEAPSANPLKQMLASEIQLLRAWDHRWVGDSEATSLAIFWGEEIQRKVSDEANRAGMSNEDYIAVKASADLLLQALAAASERLQNDFGTWKIPWGRSTGSSD